MSRISACFWLSVDFLTPVDDFTVLSSCIFKCNHVLLSLLSLCLFTQPFECQSSLLLLASSHAVLVKFIVHGYSAGANWTRNQIVESAHHNSITSYSSYLKHAGNSIHTHIVSLLPLVTGCRSAGGRLDPVTLMSTLGSRPRHF